MGSLALPRLPGRGDRYSRAGYGVYFTPEIAVESYDLVLNGLLNEMNQTHGAGQPILTTHNGFPSTATTRLPQLLRTRPELRDTLHAAMERGASSGNLPGAILRGGLRGQQGHPSGPVPPLQHRAAHGNRREPAAAAGRSAIASHIPLARRTIQRQHIANSSYHSLQLKAEKNRSASLLAPGQLCLGEIHRRCRAA